MPSWRVDRKWTSYTEHNGNRFRRTSLQLLVNWLLNIICQEVHHDLTSKNLYFCFFSFAQFHCYPLYFFPRPQFNQNGRGSTSHSHNTSQGSVSLENTLMCISVECRYNGQSNKAKRFEIIAHAISGKQGRFTVKEEASKVQKCIFVIDKTRWPIVASPMSRNGPQSSIQPDRSKIALLYDCYKSNTAYCDVIACENNE